MTATAQKIGRFEVIREVARTGVSTLSLAQDPTGETPGELAVKTVRPPQALGDVAGALDRFADSTRVQGHLAGSGAASWLPVFAFSRGSSEASAVMPMMAGSVAQLIEARVSLDHASLVTVARGTLAGLLEGERIAGRTHGLLKPSNVLLDSQTLASARVCLADPAPELPSDSHASRLEDLRALGAMVFSLITKRTFKALGGWPIVTGPTWESLGKHGDGWRAFCSRVLDPDAVPERVRTEDLLGELS